MRCLLVLTAALVLLLGPSGSVAAAPQLTVTSPTEGVAIRGTEVTVNFETNGFRLVPSPIPLASTGRNPEGNRPDEGHLMLWLDLWPVAVVARGEPYTFTDVPPGEHLLVAELVNNDHSPLSPPLVRQIRFRTEGSEVSANSIPSAMPNTGMGGARPAPDADMRYALLVLAALAMTASGLILRRRPDLPCTRATARPPDASKVRWRR